MPRLGGTLASPYELLSRLGDTTVDCFGRPVLERMKHRPSRDDERHIAADTTRDAELARRGPRAGLSPHGDHHVDAGAAVERATPLDSQCVTRKLGLSRLCAPHHAMAGRLERRCGSVDRPSVRADHENVQPIGRCHRNMLRYRGPHCPGPKVPFLMDCRRRGGAQAAPRRCSQATLHGTFGSRRESMVPMAVGPGREKLLVHRRRWSR